MRDALRVVIHLGRNAAPYFIKIGQGGKRVRFCVKRSTSPGGSGGPGEPGSCKPI